MPAQARLRNRRPAARNRAALQQATAQSHATLAETYELSPGDLANKTVVIVGAGVSGLAAAYQIRASDPTATVHVLEAAASVGGRCLSLRDGDTFTEDQTADLKSSEGTPQTVVLAQSSGEKDPAYLNAGPGRIPSSHVNLLQYMREFGVDLEVYIMESESNLVYVDPPRKRPGKRWPHNNKPAVNRRLVHNARGWLAEMVYQNAEGLVKDMHARHNQRSGDVAEKVEQLRDFMEMFGDLTAEGKYTVSAAGPGEVELPGSDRAGYTALPTVDPGSLAPAVPLDDLLDSEFWRAGLYQPKDMFWQPTLFHPVGGMDKIVDAFACAAGKEKADIQCNSAVKSIALLAGTNQYEVVTNSGKTYVADYVMCNLAIPFLEKVMAPELFNHLEMDFQAGLTAVYDAQRNKEETNRFLAYTTKVGWQAERKLWQEVPIKVEGDGRRKKRSVRSQLDVVPIFGGISWTTHPITQIWYPSTEYHAKYGVLTGAYNFGNNAKDFGNMAPADRLTVAREGAELFDKEFARELQNGVSIAWHKMPNIKGGWAQWHAVCGEEKEVDDDDIEDRRAEHFNNLAQGSGVNGASAPSLFIIGDQMSSLVGWQEGAVTAALNAISRIAAPEVKLPRLKRLPDTRVMVEGVGI